MTDTFNIINSSKNLALTSASALSRLHWLDLARDETDTLTFTLNIEAHIWLARNLIHGDFRKLADDEVDNAVDLIKNIFAEQIVVWRPLLCVFGQHHYCDNKDSNSSRRVRN
ncbi:hypothetical protein P692DRAFT_201862785 [Suillus brevipes Sb2]|nr:hypothetical protein P692DRAFT_201862785 [Suillus brevipes Sb2]